MRSLGGDQINIALSSWTLLYAFSGDPTIVENMKYLADTYLERSLPIQPIATRSNTSA